MRGRDPLRGDLQLMTDLSGLLISPPSLLKESFQRVVGKIKTPLPSGRGVSHALRREGIMNHLYKCLTIQLFRIYNLRYRLRISGNFHMPFICY